MEKKMYVVVKVTHEDFNATTVIIGVTSDIQKAQSALRETVQKEKDQQEKFGYEYDTVEEDEMSYSAYNEGYEATDSISVFIDEANEL